jgi:hypothetical protein
MMTCLTSIAALAGSPACPFFADEQVDAVAQLEHSFSHASSACFFELVFFAMVSLWFEIDRVLVPVVTLRQ